MSMSLRIKITRISKELSQQQQYSAPGVPSTVAEVPYFAIRAVSVDANDAPILNAQPVDIVVADEATLDSFVLGQIVPIAGGSTSTL